MAKDGRGIENLRHTITGYATNPNFAGVLLVGLGCEVNQIQDMPGFRGDALNIQDAGGTAAAISAGIEIAERLVRSANLCRRQSVSAANLTIGLQCGASDGYSAITANPALGAAVDRLVAAGGRAILSETPEIYGAEHLLVRRAVSPDVADTLADRLVWWEEYAARDGASLDNNPSPGNKAGGITTILEKSLGAVAKAGSTPLNAVIDYARKVTAPMLCHGPDCRRRAFDFVYDGPWLGLWIDPVANHQACIQRCPRTKYGGRHRRGLQRHIRRRQRR
jgi:altronate dehydratase